MLNKIPKDDAEVCSVIKACQETYCEEIAPVARKKKKKGTKKKEKREAWIQLVDRERERDLPTNFLYGIRNAHHKSWCISCLFSYNIHLPY